VLPATVVPPGGSVDGSTSDLPDAGSGPGVPASSASLLTLALIGFSLGFLSLLYWRWRFAEAGGPPRGSFIPTWRYAGGPAIPIVPRRSDLAALPEIVLPRFVRARFRRP
jgi:hypothetical protein